MARFFRIGIVAGMVVAAVLPACRSGPGSEQANKDLVRRYYEELVSTGDVDRLEEFISPAYVEFYEGSVNPSGLEGARQHVLGVRRVFPDLVVTVDRQFADGEWVISEITARGTHQDEWFGAAATGERMAFTGVNLDRVVDGRIVEHGGAANLLGPLLAAGAVQVVGSRARP